MFSCNLALVGLTQLPQGWFMDAGAIIRTHIFREYFASAGTAVPLLQVIQVIK